MHSGRGVKPGTRNAAKQGPHRKPFPTRIREDLIEALKAQAENMGRPLGEVADEAIESYLRSSESRSEAHP